MHHKNYNATDNTDSLPAFLIRVQVAVAGSQWIVEHKHGSFKAKAMLLLVDGILFSIPYPPQIDFLR